MQDLLKYQAARLSFGSLDPDTIKKTFDLLMERGFYAEEFREVLDSVHPRMDDVLPGFRAALDHYGIAIPSKEDAISQLIHLHASRIATGSVDAIEGLHQLMVEINRGHDLQTNRYLADSHGIGGFVGLYWSIDDVNNAENRQLLMSGFSAEAKVRVAEDWSSLRNDIRLEAERWLAANAR